MDLVPQIDYLSSLMKPRGNRSASYSASSPSTPNHVDDKHAAYDARSVPAKCAQEIWRMEIIRYVHYKKYKDKGN